MHFDLAHALVTSLVVFATIIVLEKTGVVEKGEKRRFNWKAVAIVFVVIFIFNLIWPYGP